MGLNPFPLHGKTAIVTGAGRLKGIGAAVCRALAERGADVFFTAWTQYDRAMFPDTGEDEPERLREEIERHGVRCRWMEADLSRPDCAPLVLEEAEKSLGPVSILVNNAAHSERHHWDLLTEEMLDRHYAVNVRTTVLLSVEFAHRFKKTHGGRIINLSSGQSLGPMPGEAAYALTKGAIEAFTRTFAVEVAPLGITVNAVNPGPTDTGWMNEEVRKELLPRFPFGRPGTPQDAANVIAFLAGEDASWITGQVIHSEGGYIRR